MCVVTTPLPPPPPPHPLLQVTIREHSILLLMTVLQARVCSTVDVQPVFVYLAGALAGGAPAVVAAAEKVCVRVCVSGVRDLAWTGLLAAFPALQRLGCRAVFPLLWWCACVAVRLWATLWACSGWGCGLCHPFFSPHLYPPRPPTFTWLKRLSIYTGD